MNQHGVNYLFRELVPELKLIDISSYENLHLKNNFDGQRYHELTGMSYFQIPNIVNILETATELTNDISVSAYSSKFKLKEPLSCKGDTLGITNHLEEIGLKEELKRIENEGTEICEDYIDKYRKKVDCESNKFLSSKTEKQIHEKATSELWDEFNKYNKNQSEFSSLFHDNPLNYDLNPGSIGVSMKYGFYTNLTDKDFYLGNLSTVLKSKIKAKSNVDIPKNNHLLNGISWNIESVIISFDNPETPFENLRIKAENFQEKVVDEKRMPGYTEFDISVKNGAKFDESHISDTISLFLS